MDMADDDTAPPRSGSRAVPGASSTDWAQGPVAAPARATARWTPDPWRRRALALGDRLVEADSGTVYRTTRFIGRGGMGEVYEVERGDDGERFAVKCLRLAKGDDPKVVERTRQEAIILKLIRHKNLVPVHGMGVRGDGLVWMVMDLLVGWTVGQLLDELSKVPLPWALEIMRDVCLGLAAVHEYAVHRDIKPDNLHLDKDGVTHVLDLGAAKVFDCGLITTTGFSIGTVLYMSPEQIEKPATIDQRSDIFSVGVVLYQLLSGEHPFGSKEDLLDRRRVGHAILDLPARPLRDVAPWLPPYVGEVVGRMIEKRPDDRFPTAMAVATTLESALDRLAHDLGPLPPLSALCGALALPRAEGPAGAMAEMGETPATGRAGTEILPALLSARGTERMPSIVPPGADTAGKALAETEQVPVEAFRQDAAPAPSGAATKGARSSAGGTPVTGPRAVAETIARPAPARALVATHGQEIPVVPSMTRVEAAALAERRARAAVTEQVRRLEPAAKTMPSRVAPDLCGPRVVVRDESPRRWTRKAFWVERIDALLDPVERRRLSICVVIGWVLFFCAYGHERFQRGELPLLSSWLSESAVEKAPDPAPIPGATSAPRAVVKAAWPATTVVAETAPPPASAAAAAPASAPMSASAPLPARRAPRPKAAPGRVVAPASTLPGRPPGLPPEFVF
jgi:hypothetical protein